MKHGKIKIIEFGKDEEPAGGAATGARAAGRMKIVEFDDDAPGAAQRGPARPPVAAIRIVEFDDERPRPKGERAPPPPRGPSASRARIGAIKIKEFDDEGNERARGGGHAGTARIKIVEFD